jgi:MoxR-like ATPase
MQELIDRCSQGLTERRPLVEAIALAAVAGEHVLVVGPPGTAKSEAARRVARSLGGRYFEYLLGKFSEPSEIFGPIDLRQLKEGVLETVTDGMLPEAEIAFLDEVFAGSSAILNTLLGLLNERVFRRGSKLVRCPLRVCIGASNALPEEDGLAAFADRFLIRCFVEPVSDPLLETMLEGGRRPFEPAHVPLQQLDELSQAASRVQLDEIRPALGMVLRRLRQEGIGLSDRRAVRVQNLIAAAAALAGRQQATAADLWTTVLAVPTAAAQERARACLEEALSETDSPSLWSLAEQAASASRVRARRLEAEGLRLLELPDSGERRLRIEGLLREMDASLLPSHRGPGLEELRQKLSRTLS